MEPVPISLVSVVPVPTALAFERTPMEPVPIGLAFVENTDGTGTSGIGPGGTGTNGFGI